MRRALLPNHRCEGSTSGSAVAARAVRSSSPPPPRAFFGKRALAVIAVRLNGGCFDSVRLRRAPRPVQPEPVEAVGRQAQEVGGGPDGRKGGPAQKLDGNRPAELPQVQLYRLR